jgi:hypothetical protein
MTADHVAGAVPGAIAVTTGDGMLGRRKVVRLANSRRRSEEAMVVDVVVHPSHRFFQQENHGWPKMCLRTPARLVWSFESWNTNGPQRNGYGSPFIHRIAVNRRNGPLK